MVKRYFPKTVLVMVALIGATGALAGCAPHYHLVGNHTWSSPPPQAKDPSLNISPADSGYVHYPSGKGPTAGNTSFARG